MYLKPHFLQRISDMSVHFFAVNSENAFKTIRKIQLKCVRLVIASQWQFWKLHTQNMGDFQSVSHISWSNPGCLTHIFRLLPLLVYDSRVVVKKSRHEKYLFLICFFESRHEEHFCGSCFFKSGHDDSTPCKGLVCKG